MMRWLLGSSCGLCNQLNLVWGCADQRAGGPRMTAVGDAETVMQGASGSAEQEQERERLERALAIAQRSGNRFMQENIERELEALRQQRPSPLIEQYLDQDGEIRPDL